MKINKKYFIMLIILVLLILTSFVLSLFSKKFVSSNLNIVGLYQGYPHIGKAHELMFERDNTIILRVNGIDTELGTYEKIDNTNYLLKYENGDISIITVQKTTKKDPRYGAGVDCFYIYVPDEDLSKKLIRVSDVPIYHHDITEDDDEYYKNE